MKINTTVWRALVLGVVLLLSMNAVYPRPRKHSRAAHKKSSSVKPASPAKEEVEPAQPSQEGPQVRLKLVDNTFIRVDEAWESSQGIWYKQGGVSYLVARERVKSIERNSAPTVQARGVPNAIVTGAQEIKTASRPVWIYLVGGARLEADKAEESTAGVWFHRGSLALFIERSRIDHLKREELESAAESDSSSNRERGWSTGSLKIDALIRQNGARYGVDPYLIFCVMEQESHFSAHSVSPKGARGLMQLMPGTSARFGVRHPFNPAESISAGTRYLKQLIQQFNGRIDLVLAGYNAGEGTVIRFGSKVPPYRETRDYVKRISYRYRRTKAPVVRAVGSPANAGEM
jgi:Zn-finger nucleic acid-binding protein